MHFKKSQTTDINMPFNDSSIIRQEFYDGLKKALPIGIGFIPIAMSFGVLAAQSNISFIDSILMSSMVFAGSSQFMAVNMLTIGAHSFEIIFATFVLNFRHFIMSISMMNKLKHLPLHQKALISLGITDEAFALIVMDKESDNKKISVHYIAGIIILSYISWVFGTILGGLLSMFIPASLGDSMAIGIYAMFISLLLPSIKSNYKVGIVSGISGGLCYLFNIFFSSGWAIVMATIIGGLLGSFILKED